MMCISCQLFVVLLLHIAPDNLPCNWQYTDKNLFRPIALVYVHVKEFPDDGYMYQLKHVGITFV
jgi:hypothetical protein